MRNSQISRSKALNKSSTKAPTISTSASMSKNPGKSPLKLQLNRPPVPWIRKKGCLTRSTALNPAKRKILIGFDLLFMAKRYGLSVLQEHSLAIEFNWFWFHSCKEFEAISMIKIQSMVTKLRSKRKGCKRDKEREAFKSKFLETYFRWGDLLLIQLKSMIEKSTIELFKFYSVWKPSDSAPYRMTAFYVETSLLKRVLGYCNTSLQLQRKEMSYNNYLGVDSAWNCVSDSENPTCAVMKHTNPCGEAYQLAVIADPGSTFGGIVATNVKVDKVID
ncbi:hypothetical protein YC2023_120308 [Brassica napus]